MITELTPIWEPVAVIILIPLIAILKKIFDRGK